MPCEAQKNLQISLLNATRAFVQTSHDDKVQALGQPLLQADPERLPVEPQRHPAIDRIPECKPRCWAAAEPLFDALVKAMPAMRWQTSYTVEDGFSEAYLARYAWCDLIGPEGLFFAEQHRIGFGFWHQGLDYPPHAHQPEEIYWVLAGDGWFSRDHGEFQQRVAGDIVYHAPQVWHAIETRTAPLLVLYLWRGMHLHRKSAFS